MHSFIGKHLTDIFFGEEVCQGVLRDIQEHCRGFKYEREDDWGRKSALLEATNTVRAFPLKLHHLQETFGLICAKAAVKGTCLNHLNFYTCCMFSPPYIALIDDYR